MSVYVDFMMGCLRNKNWKHNESCHLFADSEDELHELAQKIGLRRSWSQNRQKKTSFPHYDLTRSMREKAIKAGAIELTDRRSIVAKWKEIRKAREE